MSNKIKREKPNYLAVGLFIFIGIVLLVIGVIVSDKLFYKLKGGYPIYVLFDNIEGLGIGSKLIIGGGYEIGQVDSIGLDGARIKVKVLVDDKVKINRGVDFQIFSSSLMGGKYLGMGNYTGREPYIEKDSIIEGTTPFSFNQVFSALGGKTGEGGMGSAAGVFDSVANIVSSADRIVSDNETNVAITIANLAAASQRLNSLAANLDRKLASVSDAEFSKLIRDLEISVSELRIFLSDINKPDAPLSVLKDPAMNHSLRTIITNLEYTTERVKKQPSLLLK